MRPRPAVPLFFAFLLLPAPWGTPSVAWAQQATANLTVQVRDAGTGRALEGAQVLVVGAGVGGVTTAGGTLGLSGVPPGVYTVEARYLGYGTDRARVELRAGSESTVSLTLAVQPIALAEVRVRPRASVLVARGFHARAASGQGTFINREQLGKMQARRLSDVLRRVAGLSLNSPGFGGSSRARSRGAKTIGPCPIQYYLDGTMAVIIDLDQIQVSDIEGIEVYRGAATVPLMFNRGSALCGVIAIWTRNN